MLHSILSPHTHFVPPLALGDVVEEAVRIISKRKLESYAYNLRIALRRLEGTVNETIDWLDASQEASKEEYEEKKAELDTIAKYVVLFHFIRTFLLTPRFSSPIIHRLYTAAGGTGSRPHWFFN